MRSWYAVQKTGKGTGHGVFVRPVMVSIEAAGSLVARADEPAPRLTREQEDDLRALCARMLSPRSAELMIGLLVDGESLELVAERQGRSRQAAAIARSQAIAVLRRAVAA
jgi:hypothetical protein